MRVLDFFIVALAGIALGSLIGGVITDAYGNSNHFRGHYTADFHSYVKSLCATHKGPMVIYKDKATCADGTSLEFMYLPPGDSHD